MPFVMSQSVGKAGVNNPADIVLIKAALLNQKDATRVKYLPGPINKKADEVLFKDIALFKDRNGLRKTLKEVEKQAIIERGRDVLKLSSNVIGRLKNMKALCTGDAAFIIADAHSRTSPKFPDSLPLPYELAFAAQELLANKFVGYEWFKSKLVGGGRFKLALKVVGEPFLDISNNKFTSHFPKTYFKDVVGESNVWRIEFAGDVVSLTAKKSISFYAGPLVLSSEDLKIVRHYSTALVPQDPYVKSLLAAVLKPLRYIGAETKDILSGAEGREISDQRYRRLKRSKFKALETAQILSNYDNKYPAIIAKIYKDFILIALYRNVQMEPIKMVSASVEIKLILGLGLEVGYIVDPNIRKEYLYVKLSGSLGVQASKPSILFESKIIDWKELDKLKGGSVKGKAEFNLFKGQYGPFEVKFSVKMAKISDLKVQVLGGKMTFSSLASMLSAADGLEDFVKKIVTLYDKDTKEKQSQDAKPSKKVKVSSSINILHVNNGLFDFTLDLSSSSGVRAEFGASVGVDWEGIAEIETGYADAIDQFFSFLVPITLPAPSN